MTWTHFGEKLKFSLWQVLFNLISHPLETTETKWCHFCPSCLSCTIPSQTWWSTAYYLKDGIQKSDRTPEIIFIFLTEWKRGTQTVQWTFTTDEKSRTHTAQASISKFLFLQLIITMTILYCTQLTRMCPNTHFQSNWYSTNIINTNSQIY